MPCSYIIFVSGMAAILSLSLQPYTKFILQSKASLPHNLSVFSLATILLPSLLSLCSISLSLQHHYHICSQWLPLFSLAAIFSLSCQPWFHHIALSPALLLCSYLAAMLSLCLRSCCHIIISLCVPALCSYYSPFSLLVATLLLSPWHLGHLLSHSPASCN